MDKKTKIINKRDLEFLLYDWLHVEELCTQQKFSIHSREIFDSVLETAHRIALDRFAPHAAKLDQEPPEFDGERVSIIPEVKTALDAFAEAGLIATSFDMEHGGLQLPYTINQAAMSMFYSANCASAGYPLLTMAAANLLAAHGSDHQRATYMEPMLEGRFFGTMCLSEPQAGSSLGDLRTTATPREDGTYSIVGNKMWISGADHDLSENIVHLVLARLPDAPAGVKGISLFLVPKIHAEGARAGERNDVHVAGLNHKMGYRGTVNAALNFGESGDCTGYLIGAPHQGLRYMFHMMNEARVGVGLCATMLGYAGYLFSLDYARERPQGRHPWSRDPNTPQVPIIEHADVRRMLLEQKAFTEGGLALGLFCATLIDTQLAADDAAQREEATLLLDLLTPIAKAWPSEFCLEANKLAIQVMGGYGYAQEYPVERLYRDNRLNAIHEGTNGIQALDLLGRKVAMHNGAAFQTLMKRIGAAIHHARSLDDALLSELADALEQAQQRAVQTTLTLGAASAAGEAPACLANADAYLRLLGHVTIAWLWLEQATVATQKLAETQDTQDTPHAALFHGKRHAARHFLRRELPGIYPLADLLEQREDTPLTMRDAWF